METGFLQTPEPLRIQYPALISSRAAYNHNMTSSFDLVEKKLLSKETFVFEGGSEFTVGYWIDGNINDIQCIVRGDIPALQSLGDFYITNDGRLAFVVIHELPDGTVYELPMMLTSVAGNKENGRWEEASLVCVGVAPIVKHRETTA